MKKDSWGSMTPCKILPAELLNILRDRARSFQDERISAKSLFDSHRIQSLAKRLKNKKNFRPQFRSKLDLRRDQARSKAYYQLAHSDGPLFEMYLCKTNVRKWEAGLSVKAGYSALV